MSDSNESTATMANLEMMGSNALEPEVVNGEVMGAELADGQVQPMSLATLNNIPEPRPVPVPVRSGSLPLEFMADVPMELVFEVGRTHITIKQLMELGEGSFIELRHISVDSIDVRVNGKIIAEAETIAMQQRYGIRFGEVRKFTGLEIVVASSSESK